MKNKILVLMLLVSSSLFLVNCAKKSDRSETPAGPSCVAGQVPTQHGCLPQSTSCPTDFGYSNGSCYPSITLTANSTACPTAGYVNTAIGCLPPGTCPSGYGQSGNQCYPMTATLIPTNGGTCQAGTVGTALGCLPQNTCPAGYGYYYGAYNGQTGGWCYPKTY